jgi:CelD/BcsL family acetyltransferase involved in cellulose biosynthesis
MPGVITQLASDAIAPGLTTEVVSDYETFVRLQPEWNDVARRAQASSPFLLHEWFRTWWDSFGTGHTLQVVIARDGDGIVGIAPLMVEQVHMYGLPIRRLDLLHNDHTPRADWIVDRSAPSAYAALWNALQETRGRWDLLQLSRLPHDSPTLPAIAGLARRDGCLTGTWRGDVSPYLTLSGSCDSYLASLPAKFRSNLRNRLSRLTRIGEPRLEIVDRVGDGQACEDAMRLEASGWKAHAHTSIASSAPVQRFYRLLAERAAARGWLRLLFLTVGGRRIATSYAACLDGTLFLVKTGYDPEFSACAPFKVLTYLAIQHAYAEGLREIDFLGDTEAWKLEWTDTSRPHDWLFVFADTIRARLLHSLKFQVAPELKRWRA